MTGKRLDVRLALTGAVGCRSRFHSRFQFVTGKRLDFWSISDYGRDAGAKISSPPGHHSEGEGKGV